MKKLYITIGNVGSGKTTYIKSVIDNEIVISKDDLRYSLGAGSYIFDVKLEPAVHRSILQTLNFFLITNRDIFLDETNIDAHYREQFITIAKNHDYKIIALVFPKFNKKLSVDRRMTNPHGCPDRKIWNGVWDKFNKKYDAPTFKEGFDEITYINPKLLICKKEQVEGTKILVIPKGMVFGKINGKEVR